MNTHFSNYKIPKQIAYFSIGIGLLPLIPFLLGGAIATLFGVQVTEAGPPNMPFGELVYILIMCFWGFIVSLPIAVMGMLISAVWFICVFSINCLRVYQGRC
jgi:hypothetical protein